MRSVPERQIRQVCVYCASSQKVDHAYLHAAAQLGELLAGAHITLVYGGGGSGLMGAVADGALRSGGKVIGVLPRFMEAIEWGHTGLTELRLVDDMHERKRVMIESADAVVALPGGSGTLEELLEVITLKRLGIFLHPIVLANLRGFYDPLIRQFDEAIRQGFMDERHREMWSVVTDVSGVLTAIRDSPEWGADARSFARV